MTGHCKATILGGSGGWRRISCSKKATKDSYCGTHHPDAVKRREAKAKAEMKEWHEKYARLDFDKRAGDKCRELGIQPEEIK